MDLASKQGDHPPPKKKRSSTITEVEENTFFANICHPLPEACLQSTNRNESPLGRKKQNKKNKTRSARPIKNKQQHQLMSRLSCSQDWVEARAVEVEEGGRVLLTSHHLQVISSYWLLHHVL